MSVVHSLPVPLVAVAALLAALGAPDPLRAEPPPIVLDGAMDDWAAGTGASADPQRILLRFDAPEVYTLQNGPVSTVLALDVDSSGTTGYPAGEGAGAMGVDLEITLSPPDYNRPGSMGRGVQIHAYGEDGLVESLTHADAGFLFMPTYAAPSYEIRLSRVPSRPQWLADRMGAATSLAGRFERRDEWGQVQWTSPAFTLALPAPGAGAPASAALPARGEGEFRVMTWNVLWGTPMRDPAPFARVLRAINPDVVLIQEWDNRRDEEPRIAQAEIVKWFRANAPDGPSWRIVQSVRERGVLLAARHPTAEFLPDGLEPVSAPGRSISFEHGVRAVSARIKSPIGEVGAVSVHFSCCGSKDSVEDRRRAGEARAIAQAVEEARIAGGPDVVIIGGDFNLVGSSEPLDVLLGTTSLDGSRLVAVEARSLDGADAATWREDRNDFSPGRLDWVVVGGRGVEVARSFIFDTQDLSDGALRAAGLQRSDSSGTDHLPVVVDIRRAPAR